MSTLGETGQVYVTLAAAERYADQRDLGDEEARRQLTELALDAKLKGDPERSPEQWRLRSTAHNLDLTLRVVDEPPLRVVVAANARGYQRRSNRGSNKPKP